MSTNSPPGRFLRGRFDMTVLPVVAVSIAFGAALSTGSKFLTAATMALPLGIVICLLPMDVLPAVVLAATVLIPSRQLPIDPTGTGNISPAAALILVWMLRSLMSNRSWNLKDLPFVPLMVTALFVWMTILTTRAGDPKWVGAFTVSVLVPCMLPMSERAHLLLRTWFRHLATFVGTYAIIEGFLLKRNPLLDWAYLNAGDNSIDQSNWSVYRATTTLGHPLNGGLFLAAAAMFCLHHALGHRRKRDWISVAIVIAGLGATGSRAALLAFAGGAFILIGHRSITQRKSNVVSTVITLMLVAICLIPAASYVGQRAKSAEAADSSAAREVLTTIAFDLFHQHPFIGIGPGTSDVAVASRNSLGLRLENSWLELLVSSGLITVAMFFSIVAWCVYSAFRRRDSGSAAALLVFAVCIGAFNFLEVQRSTLALMGLLFALCRHVPITQAGIEQRDLLDRSLDLRSASVGSQATLRRSPVRDFIPDASR